MKNIRWAYGVLVIFFLITIACNTDKNKSAYTTQVTTMPSKELQGVLDKKSEEIVTLMEKAMGGREAYDAIQHLQWNFFGSRKWWWNKWTGDVRCESLRSDISIAMNIQSQQGQVILNGKIQTHPDSLSKYLDKGYRWWINDSYWLVMPFKLKDNGVNLKYLGTRKTETDSIECDVMRLTFQEVGVTPANMYDLYVDPKTALLVQWDFYRTQQDSLPGFQMPWLKYQEHQDVLFSGDRGGRKIEEIEAYTDLPELIYTDLTNTGKEILANQE
jgi:hypothetical protein